MSLIIKTDIMYDLDSMIESYEKIMEKYPFDIHNRTQIGFTHRPKCQDPVNDAVGSMWDFENRRLTALEKDFTIFNEEFKDTYFYEIYKTFPYKIGRMRLMFLPSRKCMSMHNDFEKRWHMALVTNDNSYIFFKDEDTYKIPSDGYAYEMDATQKHTAFNSGKTHRIHLLLNSGE